MTAAIDMYIAHMSSRIIMAETRLHIRAISFFEVDDIIRDGMRVCQYIFASALEINTETAGFGGWESEIINYERQWRQKHGLFEGSPCGGSIYHGNVPAVSPVSGAVQARGENPSNDSGSAERGEHPVSRARREHHDRRRARREARQGGRHSGGHGRAAGDGGNGASL